MYAVYMHGRDRASETSSFAPVSLPKLMTDPSCQHSKSRTLKSAGQSSLAPAIRSRESKSLENNLYLFMEVLLGWRLQLDSRPELEPFALRWQDRLLTISGEQSANGRKSEHVWSRSFAINKFERCQLSTNSFLDLFFLTAGPGGEAQHF